MHRFCKGLLLAGIGGLIYAVLELLYRGRTHWTMMVLGGVLFVLIGLLNEVLPWDMPLVLQGLLGALAVTGAELAAGLILNVRLGLGIWDYSNVPLNLWGQICLPFSALWVLLSAVAVVLDDWLRYWIWHEERPHYTVFKSK